MRLTLIAIAFALFVSGALCGQTPPPLKGGEFVYKGKKIAVSASQIARHYEISARFAPQAEHRLKLVAAWGRAFRVAVAQALELPQKAGPEEYTTWMRKAHHGHRADLLVDGRVNYQALTQFAKKRGFDDIVAYEQFCRDEFASDLFVKKVIPPQDIDEAQVLSRAEDLGTGVLLDVAVVASETLATKNVVDADDPTVQIAYENWYKGLSDRQKLIFDDDEHPALAAEAIYIRFDDKDRAQMKAFFTKSRPGLGGKSLAEITANYPITPLDEARLQLRWQEERRRHLAPINAELTSGLDDTQSYAKVRDHLVRILRCLKYLEVIWKDLRGREGPFEMKAIAQERGLSYRRFPLQVRRKFDNDAVLPGDHSAGLLNRTQPGQILDYLTSASTSDRSQYFVDGVVEQPGLHGSIFRLTQKEPMQIRRPNDVKKRAWPEFVKRQRWAKVLTLAKSLAGRWRTRVNAAGGGPQATIEKQRAARVQALGEFVTEESDVRMVEGIYIEPYATDINQGGTRRLESRLRVFLKKSWPKAADGLRAKDLQAGLVLGFVLGTDDRLAAIPRIAKIKRPRKDRLAKNPELLRRARALLENERDALRAHQLARQFAIDQLRQQYSLKSPDLDAVLGAK